MDKKDLDSLNGLNIRTCLEMGLITFDQAIEALFPSYGATKKKS